MIPNNDKNRTYSVVYLPKVEGLHKVRKLKYSTKVPELSTTCQGLLWGMELAQVSSCDLNRELWSRDISPILPLQLFTFDGITSTSVKSSWFSSCGFLMY